MTRNEFNKLMPGDKIKFKTGLIPNHIYGITLFPEMITPNDIVTFRRPAMGDGINIMETMYIYDILMFDVVSKPFKFGK